MELKNNIINKFDQMGFYEKYDTDIWITILSIIFVTFISFYFLIRGFIKSYKAVWQSKKCNPIFMPFAGFINSDSTNSDFDNTKKNFDECLNELNFNIGMEFKSPLDALFSFFMIIFNFVSYIIGLIMNFFLYLLNLLLSFFKMILEKIKELLQKTQEIFYKLRGLANNIIDFLDIIKYTLKNMFDFLRFTFFLIASSFSKIFVLPSIIIVIVLTIIAIISFILAVIFSWFPPVGIPLMTSSIITRVLAIVALIIMIFLIMLSINLDKGIKNAVCNSHIFTDLHETSICQGVKKITKQEIPQKMSSSLVAGQLVNNLTPVS